MKNILRTILGLCIAACGVLLVHVGVDQMLTGNSFFFNWLATISEGAIVLVAGVLVVFGASAGGIFRRLF